MDAETAKTESEREHQKKAAHYNQAVYKLQLLESKLSRNINKSRPYFEEKELCQGQLAAQKDRVESLQLQVAAVKRSYANSLKELEAISLEIHQKRGNVCVDDAPGVREPGVGAEETVVVTETAYTTEPSIVNSKVAKICSTNETNIHNLVPNITQTMDRLKPFPGTSGYSELDYELELDRCDIHSIGSTSAATSSAVSDEEIDDSEVEELRQMAGEGLSTPATPRRGEYVDGSLRRVGTPRRGELVEGARRLSEQWEKQVGETISKLGAMLTISGRGSGSSQGVANSGFDKY